MISIVVGIGKRGQIGKDNQLLWHISDDLKNFKKLTLHKPMIMGRKTFDSIGKPLPKRQSLVLTRDENFSHEGVIVFHSIEDVLAWAKENSEELMVIGGSEIYSLFMPYTDRIYLSRIDFDGDADTYFREPDWNEWNLKEEVDHPATENQLGWRFQVYERPLN